MNDPQPEGHMASYLRRESRRGKRTILGIEIRGVLDQPRRKWDARATSSQCNVTVSICALAAQRDRWGRDIARSCNTNEELCRVRSILPRQANGCCGPQQATRLCEGNPVRVRRVPLRGSANAPTGTP